MKIKATNIEWDIDMDEVYEKLDDLTIEDAAEALEVPVNTYANMTTTERHDYAYDIFHHRPGKLYDFLLLPEEVEIIADVEEDESVDYLSDNYGYCIKSLHIEIVEETVSDYMNSRETITANALKNRYQDLKDDYGEDSDVIKTFCNTLFTDSKNEVLAQVLINFEDVFLGSDVDLVLQGKTYEEMEELISKREKEAESDIGLGSFTVDVQLQPNGKFDVYIGHEGSSGEHYTDVTADRIGELVADDVECIAEGYQNEFR